MAQQHDHPCKQCPFRRDAMPGYLGDDTPEGFMSAFSADVRLPCHMAVDYEEGDWKDAIETAPQCAGAAIMRSNSCKKPRDKSILTLPRDTDTVFNWPHEFIKHHSNKPSPLK